MTDKDAHAAGALRAIPDNWKQPPAEMIGHLPKGGTQLDYLGHALVTLILTEIDPMWTLTYVEDDQGLPIVTFQGSDAVLWGTLTVHGKSFKGVGVCTAKAFDLHKQLISDLLKNTAMRFGVGTMLWSKEEFVSPPPPPEPLASPSQVGEIRAGIAGLSDATAFKAWWKQQGLPKLEVLTESQAATVLARLSDSHTSAGVEPSEAPEGPSSGEVQPSVADPVGDGHEGEAGGTGHPAGPPTAAARAALNRSKP